MILNESGSASGKTTLCEKIQQQLINSDICCIISLDSFYKG